VHDRASPLAVTAAEIGSIDQTEFESIEAEALA
jgi:hypothetical protein